MRRSPWVLATYAILLILGIGMAIPNFLPATTRASLPGWTTATTVPLGLDLRGGAHLLLAVDRADLAAARNRALRDTLADTLREAGQSPAALRQIAEGFLLPADDPALATALRALGPDGITVTETPQGLLVADDPDALDRAAAEAAGKSVEVIRHRIDQVGIAEPVIRRVGTDRILVQLPGVENPGQLRALLGSTARMDFHMVDEGATTAKPGYTMLPLREGGQIAVEDRVALDGTHLEQATSGFDPQTRAPVVNFRFDRAGAVAFGEITAANVGRQFAVVLDGQVLTAPVIRQPIPGGQGQISGNFTVDEAQTLAVLLNSGALPASLEVIEERSVGAALGSDSIRMGLVTGLAGAGLVVALMVLLYGGWGLLASAALAVNVLFTLTALGIIGATLTLPGIAGIILCLGIAVDANILIFSRIREETARGAPAMKALARGYDRAWATIWDANITTLLAMVLLFAFGAGAIRGFAVTMTLGILISMFTAIVLTRIAMEWLARRQRLKVLQIAPLLGRVPRPGSIRFLRRGGLALALSALLSTGSLALLAEPGPALGIDFTGGAQLVLSSADPIPMSELRATLAAQNLGDASLQEFGAPTEVLIRVQGEARQATVEVLETAVRAVVPDARFDQIELVGPAISAELATTGLVALSLALMGMLGYIWVRFEWHFALSAIGVLILDVTKTLGVVALMGWEVNLTTIVALLTLIGYSVNDKVVVYDRIRENLRVPQKAGFAALIERSLNQVLARCLFTSGTTVLALLPMALWGGGAVAGFAWPMIAGVVIATGSSLFVAGPILNWMAPATPAARSDAQRA